MKAGDVVRTPKGLGTLLFVGGVPDPTPHPEYDGWVQQQVVVVEHDGSKFLFCIGQIEEVKP